MQKILNGIGAGTVVKKVKDVAMKGAQIQDLESFYLMEFMKWKPKGTEEAPKEKNQIKLTTHRTTRKTNAKAKAKVKVVEEALARKERAKVKAKVKAKLTKNADFTRWGNALVQAIADSCMEVNHHRDKNSQ